MKHLNLREKVVCLLIILILFSVLSGFLVQKKAAFASLSSIDEAINQLDKTAKQAKLGEEKDVATIVGRIIGIVLALISIILVVLMIAGGFMWMTSAGNPEKVTKARELMTNALIGLIIIVLAYAIANFVVDKLSGVTTPTSAPPPPPPP
ncbi:pilin [Patescibacteria group bacterium]|nr:pilin [Patescibacteria group bacterium]